VYSVIGFLLDLGVNMKVTMTKIWVAAALLALIGIAQAQSRGGSATVVSAHALEANPYLNVKHK